MRNYAKTLLKSSSNICFGYLLESPQRGDSNKYPKHMFYEELRLKQGFFSYHSVYYRFFTIANSLQWQCLWEQMLSL